MQAEKPTAAALPYFALRWYPAPAMQYPKAPTPLHFLLAVYAGWINRKQLDVIEYLRAENAVLREHIPHKRVPFTDKQRLKLAHAAKRAGRALLREFASIAKPDTLLGWYRQLVARKYDGSARRRRGRPPLSDDIKRFIIQLARDNPRWGYSKILGALKALDIEVSRPTVRRVLLAVGLDPDERRGPGTRWKDFLAAHWGAITATDFFTVEVLTWRGIVRMHVLFVIELKTRMVEVAGIVPEPDGAWVKLAMRGLLDAVDGFLLGKTHLIMDRGSVFSTDVRTFLRNAGVEPVRLPPNSPNLNAYAERFVRSVRQECLDHMIVLGERHLRHVIREYVTFYNHERPHQGIGNVMIRAPDQPANCNGPVKCRQRLGGLLKSYHREVA